jgi:hypothetical protein
MFYKRETIMTKRRTFFVLAVCLSITVFSVQISSQAANANRTANTTNIEGSQLNPAPETVQGNRKIAESLNISWSSIEYEKTLYNPALTSNKQGRPKSIRLFISCDVEMPDSGLILTTCPDAIIEQITDSRGSYIAVLPSQATYKYIHQPRSIRGFMPEGQTNGPEYSHLWVKLDDGLPEHISGKIRLKGHFYALIAESLEYVELPFEPNDQWVRLTPEVEVRVRQARNETSQYLFDIEQHPETVTDFFDVQIGDYLPGRLIVDRQFIGKTSAAGAGGGHSTGRIGGEGSGIGRAEKIRFTIAVNPTHQKIPFELEQIPLSVFAEPAPSQKHTSNQTELTAVKMMPEPVKPQFNKKVADCFEVNWVSVTYHKSLYNSSVYGVSPDQSVSENLLVRCQAKILDPRLIVGTCDTPVIERITDDKGRIVDIGRMQSGLNRLCYSPLQYQPSLIPALPSGLIYWEGRARRALGLPLKARHLPKRTLVLQPVHIGIDLDPGLLRQDIQEISSIKGYFHALTAESLKHVKVPFKSSDKWIRLTSDVEIQVSKVLQTESSSQFEIKQRGQGTRPRTPLCVGDSLPEELFVDRQFIGSEDRSSSLSAKVGRQLPAGIDGSGSISGRQIKKIDYLIAVDPNHNRIPFEFEHIPLPKP